MMNLPLSNRYLYIPIFGVSWSRGDFFFRLFLGHGVVFDLSYLGVSHTLLFSTVGAFYEGVRILSKSIGKADLHLFVYVMDEVGKGSSSTFKQKSLRSRLRPAGRGWCRGCKGRR